MKLMKVSLARLSKDKMVYSPVSISRMNSDSIREAFGKEFISEIISEFIVRYRYAFDDVFRFKSKCNGGLI